MKEALGELQGTIMKCISSDMKIPTGTTLIERHHFFSHLSRRANIFPFELVEDAVQRLKVSALVLACKTKINTILKFLQELRESAMTEAAEKLTVGAAALLMRCNKASGMFKLSYSGNWTENCKKIKKELEDQVSFYLFVVHFYWKLTNLQIKPLCKKVVVECAEDLVNNLDYNPADAQALSDVGMMAAVKLYQETVNVVEPLFTKTFVAVLPLLTFCYKLILLTY